MGGSASKAVRTAAGSSPRKYPTRDPPASTLQSAKPSALTPSASLKAPPPPREFPRSNGKGQSGPEIDQPVNINLSDPLYASHLRTIGVVNSNPFQSNSTTNPMEQPLPPKMPPQVPGTSRRPEEPSDVHQPFPISAFPDPRNNPALAILEARQKLQEQVDQELQQARTPGFPGRQFVDVGIIRQILQMRDDRGMDAEQIEKTLELKRGTVARLGAKGVVESLKN